MKFIPNSFVFFYRKMSNKCSAFMCNKTFIHGIELFKFPKNCSHNWIFAVDRGPSWKPKATSRLCSHHFPQVYVYISCLKIKF